MKLYSAIKIIIQAIILSIALASISVLIGKYISFSAGVFAFSLFSVSAIIFGWRSKRRKYKYIFYLGAISLVILPIIYVSLVIVYLNPFLDDGPFAGISRSDCPSGTPAQVFAINLGRTIEVFVPLEGDLAPTVVLKKENNSIDWCIYAVGQDGALVKELRFSTYSEAMLSKDVTISGVVHWTFGRETMTWKIDEDGAYQYWFSW